MADISTAKGKGINRAPFNFQTPYETRIYDISPATDGVTAAEAHTIASVEAGKALVGFKVVGLTSVTGGAGFTIAFAFNSVALTGNLTALAAGAVVKPSLTLVGATAGVATGTTSAALTLTMTVGTNTLSAGRFLVYLDLVDWSAATTNG